MLNRSIAVCFAAASLVAMPIQASEVRCCTGGQVVVKRRVLLR